MPTPIQPMIPARPAPAELLGVLRANWTNLPAAVKADGAAPPFPVTTPAQTPIARLPLPAAVQQSLAAHPAVTWVKLVHARDGEVVSVVDDGSPLPPDNRIVHVQVSTMSASLTGTSADTYLVVGAA